jgi:HPt (histidine-containing phosphotransfer) domain-containing protein
MTMAADDTLSSTLALLRQLPQASRESMVRMYRHSLREHLDLVAAGLAPGGDMQAVAAPAHRIAGSAGMMQDLALCDVARTMEVALREGRPDDARAQWPQLVERAQQTLDALTQAYPGVD